jgi:hypothetical protein
MAGVERVTQCAVDSTKILGYVTVEYYCLYYSNICSYLVEYLDSSYSAYTSASAQRQALSMHMHCHVPLFHIENNGCYL